MFCFREMVSKKKRKLCVLHALSVPFATTLISIYFFVFLPVFDLVLVCNALRHRQRPSIHRARQTWLHVCFGSLSLYWSQIMNMNS